MARKLLFLDTETTGNEEKDRLVQIAYGLKYTPDASLDLEKVVNSLYKPPIPISIESMAVHHITNKMVENKPPFKWSAEHAELKKLFSDEDTVLVAHNAKFDIEILKKEELNPITTICTLRVARALDAKNMIPRYNLQYLRYYLEIEINAPAHDARGDVLVLEQLFERLLKKTMDANGYDLTQALERMIEISNRPSLIYLFTFGKYNGKTVEEVAKIDRGYLEWLLGQKETNDRGDEDWIYTLKYHLGKLP